MPGTRTHSLHLSHTSKEMSHTCLHSSGDVERQGSHPANRHVLAVSVDFRQEIVVEVLRHHGRSAQAKHVDNVRVTIQLADGETATTGCQAAVFVQGAECVAGPACNILRTFLEHILGFGNMWNFRILKEGCCQKQRPRSSKIVLVFSNEVGVDWNVVYCMFCSLFTPIWSCELALWTTALPKSVEASFSTTSPAKLSCETAELRRDAAFMTLKFQPVGHSPQHASLPTLPNAESCIHVGLRVFPEQNRPPLHTLRYFADWGSRAGKHDPQPPFSACAQQMRIETTWSSGENSDGRL